MFGITPIGNKYVVMTGMAAECIVVWQLAVMILLSAVLAKRSGQKLIIPAIIMIPKVSLTIVTDRLISKLILKSLLMTMMNLKCLIV